MERHNGSTEAIELFTIWTAANAVLAALVAWWHAATLIAVLTAALLLRLLR